MTTNQIIVTKSFEENTDLLAVSPISSISWSTPTGVANAPSTRDGVNGIVTDGRGTYLATRDPEAEASIDDAVSFDDVGTSAGGTTEHPVIWDGVRFLSVNVVSARYSFDGVRWFSNNHGGMGGASYNSGLAYFGGKYYTIVAGGAVYHADDPVNGPWTAGAIVSGNFTNTGGTLDRWPVQFAQNDTDLIIFAVDQSHIDNLWYYSTDPSSTSPGDWSVPTWGVGGGAPVRCIVWAGTKFYAGCWPDSSDDTYWADSADGHTWTRHLRTWTIDTTHPLDLLDLNVDSLWWDQSNHVYFIGMSREAGSGPNWYFGCPQLYKVAVSTDTFTDIATPGDNTLRTQYFAGSYPRALITGRPIDDDPGIGGVVYFDEDADGVFDTAESGMAGIDVKLYQDTDLNGSYETLVETVTTDGEGGFTFATRAAGNYKVELDTGTLPAGYATTNATFHNTTIAATSRYFEFGVSTCTVTVRAAVDVDGDGVLDGGTDVYPVIGFTPDMRARLLYDSDSNGSYETTIDTLIFAGVGFGPAAVATVEFDALEAGDYRLQVLFVPSGYELTTPDHFDFTLALGDDTSRDFLIATATLSGRCWADANHDGSQGIGEGGVTPSMDLYQDTDLNGSYETLVDTVVPAFNGNYTFEGVTSGNYRIIPRVATFPAGKYTLDHDHLDVTVVAAVDQTGLDFPFGSECVVQGYVFQDDNSDGVLDGGESFVVVPVELRSSEDGYASVIATDDSNSSFTPGRFVFDGLRPTALPVTYRINIDTTDDPMYGIEAPIDVVVSADGTTSADQYLPVLPGFSATLDEASTIEAELSMTGAYPIEASVAMAESIGVTAREGLGTKRAGSTIPIR